MTYNDQVTQVPIFLNLRFYNAGTTYPSKKPLRKQKSLTPLTSRRASTGGGQTEPAAAQHLSQLSATGNAKSCTGGGTTPCTSRGWKPTASEVAYLLQGREKMEPGSSWKWHDEKTRHNGHSLEHEKLQLDIRKTFFFFPSGKGGHMVTGTGYPGRFLNHRGTAKLTGQVAIIIQDSII